MSKEDIIDAISFIKWQTPKEIADKSNIKISEVKKVLKELLVDNTVEQKGGTYRYENGAE